MDVEEGKKMAALVHRGITLVSLPDLQVTGESRGARGTSRCCALSADGEYLLTGQHSGVVALLRKKNGRFVLDPAEQLPKHDGQVRSIEFLPGRSAFITAGTEGALRRRLR
jgi:WD40 repeat protein